MSDTITDNLRSESIVSIDSKIINVTGDAEQTEGQSALVQCPPFVTSHLMRHDLNSEIGGSSKRFSKFGVKVPCKVPLTSQIVTQEEIAKEIFERSLKKYPYENFKSTELLMNMKLTGNSSSRIGSIASTKIVEIQSDSTQNEETCIKDNRELLAILKDSPDSSMEKCNTSSTSSNSRRSIKSESKAPKNTIYEFIKMHPELEKELALKQLEEFTKPKKKKEESGDVNKDSQVKKVLQKRKKLKSPESNNNNETKSREIVNIRAGRKRKLFSPDSPMKKRVLRKTNGVIPFTQTVAGSASSTVADVSQITESPTIEDGLLLTVSTIKDNKYIRKYVNRRLASRSDEDVECCDTSTVNGSRSNEVHISVEQTDAILSPKSNKTVEKNTDLVVNSSNKVNEVTEDGDNTKSPSKSKKPARVKREIAMLLGDEGAINMLYSVEQQRAPGTTPSRRGILQSTRRKKKDLILKTRLVKNAVLRLSSSPPQSLGKAALRARRETSFSQGTPDSSNSEPLHRKTSVESRESQQSASLNSPAHVPCFAYPEKLSVPAEASRIIRRHSSSSSYSSRSNSPRRPSVDADRSPLPPQSASSPEKVLTDAEIILANSIKLHSHNSSKRDVSTDKTKRLSTRCYNDLEINAECLQDGMLNELGSVGELLNTNEDSDSNSVVFKKDVRILVKNKMLSSEFTKSLQKDEPITKLNKTKKSNISKAVAELHSVLNSHSKHESSSSITASSSGSSDSSPIKANAANYLKDILVESQKKKDGDDKQRLSIRQNAGSYSYKEISLRRYEHVVQIIFTPVSTTMKNAFNHQVLKELTSALNCLKKDDTCRVVFFTSTGSAFCYGIDLTSLIHQSPEKRKAAALELVVALKDFIKSLATFNKPLIAGVHGAAVGLGVTMLPFFDMVFASDKATFHTPYARLGQIPEGAATLTLPQMLGNAVTSELLFGCRRLTASEALRFGLVTRVLWPDRFQEELIPLMRGIATQSSQSMNATKSLLRSGLCSKLDNALLTESQILLKHWVSNECQNCFKQYLEEETPTLQK